MSSAQAAATATWVSSTTGGNWVDAANWTGSAAPTSSSYASLLNVTSGTRTIMINSGENATAKTITLSQTTAGAANNLTIASGGTLTLGVSGSAVQNIGVVTGGSSLISLGGTLALTGGVAANGYLIGSDLTMSDGAKITAAAQGTLLAFGGVVNSAGSVTISNSNALTAVFNSTLNVNSGTLEFYQGAGTGTVALTSVTVKGATTIASGATVKLSGPSTGNFAGTAFINTGTLTQEGTISLNGRASATTTYTQVLSNSGTWVVSGSGAVIEKLTNGTVAPEPTFTNTVGGILKGTGTLDYNNLASAGTNIAATNAGTIQMGNGTNGTGTIGDLALTDFALTLSSTSVLEFDLGGTTSGLFDTFTLNSSSMVLGGTLSLYLVNGFAPTSDFSINLILGGSTLSGNFTSLLVNGVADSNYTFSYANGIGTLSYVPEPETWALLITGVMLCVWVSHRRRAGSGQSLSL